MPSTPTVPLYPPQGIQAELDLLYLFSRTALDSLEQTVKDMQGKVDANSENIEKEIDRATEAERALEEKIDGEIARATASEQELDGKIVAETARAEAAEEELTNSLSSAVDSINNNLIQINAALSTVAESVNDIQEVIPSQASASNQLADKAFVNSTVQTSTANFRGNWPTFADVPSDVNSYPEDFAGSKTPTVNDYLVVEADETHGGATWRYKYTGNWATEGKNGWEPEYKLNDTPFTANQLAALNSGITAEYVSQIDTNRHDISDCKGDISALENDKQDKLTAGDNITIENNVISAAKGLPDMSDATAGMYLTNENGEPKWEEHVGLIIREW